MSPRWKARVWQAFGGAALAALAFGAGAVRPLQQAASTTEAPQPKTRAEPAQHRQLADDSAQLLKAAVALKGEVDKTNKDMLSLSVIRKAEEVEKMARALRERHGAAQ